MIIVLIEISFMPEYLPLKMGQLLKTIRSLHNLYFATILMMMLAILENNQVNYLKEEPNIRFQELQSKIVEIFLSLWMMMNIMKMIANIMDSQRRVNQKITTKSF